MNRLISRSFWCLLGLTLSLLFPSFGQVEKYFGGIGLALYTAGGLIAILIIRRYFLARFFACKLRTVSILALITFLVLILAFTFIYPLADSGIITPGGSDNDEDLDVGAKALLQGEYPYYAEYRPGSHPAKLPGSTVLALPFVLLGHSAYQNLFWILAFFGVASLYLKSVRQALLLLWTILILSPVVLQQLVTGTTGITNSLYVLCFAFFTIRWVSGKASHWRKILIAILLGVSLSSRVNYLLILPLVFSALVQNAGWKPAIGYTLLSCAAFGAITLPFYFYDPSGFFPIYNQWSFVSRFQSVLPFSGILIPLMGVLVAFLLSFKRMAADGRDLFAHCAIVQAVPVFLTFLLSNLVAGRLNFQWAAYGVNFLFFVALACWSEWADLRWQREENRKEEVSPWPGGTRIE